MNITAEFQLPSLIQIEYIDEFCIILHDEHTYLITAFYHLPKLRHSLYCR